MAIPNPYVKADWEADRKVSAATRRGAVLDLMRDGKWHATAELDDPLVGGSEGTRRLRELRAKGYTFEKRRHDGHDDFEYRLLSITEAVKRKVTHAPGSSR